jgi:hypothetical protein
VPDERTLMTGSSPRGMMVSGTVWKRRVEHIATHFSARRSQRRGSPESREGPREVGMSCPNCQGDDRKLYRVPLVQQLGSVPIATACFFCYIKITGNRPPSAELVPGSGAGSNA